MQANKIQINIEYKQCLVTSFLYSAAIFLMFVSGMVAFAILENSKTENNMVLAQTMTIMETN